MAENNNNDGQGIPLPRRMVGPAEDEDYNSDIDDVEQRGWDDQPLVNRTMTIEELIQRSGQFDSVIGLEAFRMIRELAFQNQELKDDVQRLRDNCDDLRRRVNAISQVPQGTRWYAVARGDWDGETFVELVTTLVDEYRKATEGKWKPVAKSFETQEEAQGFILQHRAHALSEGMKFVRNGVFSRDWYEVCDDHRKIYTIISNSDEGEDMVSGRNDRFMEKISNAMDHRRDGYAFVDRNDFERYELSHQVGQQKCVGIT